MGCGPDVVETAVQDRTAPRGRGSTTLSPHNSPDRPAHSLRVDARRVDAARRFRLAVSNERRQCHVWGITDHDVDVIREDRLCVDTHVPMSSRIQHGFPYELMRRPFVSVLCAAKCATLRARTVRKPYEAFSPAHRRPP